MLNQLRWVSIISVLDIYYSFTLSFGHHIYCNRSCSLSFTILNVLQSTWSFNCLRSLCFALPRIIFEYGIIIWNPYLAKDQLRLDFVQHIFLSYAAFILKLPSSNHEYSDISRHLSIPSLSSRCNYIDYQFIHALLNNSIGVPDLLSQVLFKVSSYYVRKHTPFKF